MDENRFRSVGDQMLQCSSDTDELILSKNLQELKQNLQELKKNLEDQFAFLKAQFPALRKRASSQAYQPPILSEQTCTHKEIDAHSLFYKLGNQAPAWSSSLPTISSYSCLNKMVADNSLVIEDNELSGLEDDESLNSEGRTSIIDVLSTQTDLEEETRKVFDVSTEPILEASGDVYIENTAEVSKIKMVHNPTEVIVDSGLDSQARTSNQVLGNSTSNQVLGNSTGIRFLKKVEGSISTKQKDIWVACKVLDEMPMLFLVDPKDEIVTNVDSIPQICCGLQVFDPGISIRLGIHNKLFRPSIIAAFKGTLGVPSESENVVNKPSTLGIGGVQIANQLIDKLPLSLGIASTLGRYADRGYIPSPCSLFDCAFTGLSGVNHDFDMMLGKQDVELQIGKMLLFTFDPGGGFWLCMDFDPIDINELKHGERMYGILRSRVSLTDGHWNIILLGKASKLMDFMLDKGHGIHGYGAAWIHRLHPFIHFKAKSSQLEHILAIAMELPVFVWDPGTTFVVSLYSLHH